MPFQKKKYVSVIYYMLKIQESVQNLLYFIIENEVNGEIDYMNEFLKIAKKGDNHFVPCQS